ncbi:hypothetical protein [Streptomyces sp. NPDC001933]|uniref:hypothetical protein n=1 Tax=Streptomyces sp. NPDC001933 TaxID=3364626 RepID=UPI0036CEA4E3
MDTQYSHRLTGALSPGSCPASPTADTSSSKRGGRRSHSGSQGPTKEQLYSEAKQRNIRGRSKMNKKLANALGHCSGRYADRSRPPVQAQSCARPGMRHPRPTNPAKDTR